MDSNRVDTKDREVNVDQEVLELFNYEPTVEHIKEQLQLPEVSPLTNGDRLAGASARFAIQTKLRFVDGAPIRAGIVQNTLIHTSEFIAAVEKGRHIFHEKAIPKNIQSPAKRDSSWGVFVSWAAATQSESVIVDTEPGSYEEETYLLKSRFDHVIPLLGSEHDLSDEELHQIVFSTVIDREKAFPWRDPEFKRTERDYQLNLEGEDDVVVFSDHEWSNDVDPEIFKDKVVMVKVSNAQWGSEHGQQELKTVLEKSKLVMMLVDDKKEGAPQRHLHVIVPDHATIDGAPVGHLATRISERIGGVDDDVEDDHLQSILNSADSRYNLGQNEHDGAVKSVILDKETVENFNKLYHQYTETLLKGWTHKLEFPYFIELMMHEAAGVDMEKVVGTRMNLKTNINEQLDNCALSTTLPKLRELITKKTLGKIGRDQFIRRNQSMLNTNNVHLSNVSGLIAPALKHVPDAYTQARLARATMRNAARSIAGQVLSSHLEDGFQVRLAEYEPKKFTYTYDNTQISGYGSTSPLVCHEIGFTVSTKYSYEGTETTTGKGRRTGVERVVVRTKANWESGKK